MGVVSKLTISDWVAIAGIVTTVGLIVSTVALYLSNLNLAKLENAKLRMNRPDRTPDPSPPKKGGWFIRFLESPWQLPLFLILTNLFTLVLELRSTTPITRWGVYRISSAMAGIWYGAILILLNKLWQSIRRQWQINAEHSQIDREIIDILRSLASDSYTIDGKIVDLVRSLAIGLHTTAEALALEQKVRQLETEQAELEKSGQGRLSRLLKVLLGD